MKILIASVLLVAYGVLATAAAPPNLYNVVWDSPSKDHTGSMPLGNGDIGLNTWVEPNGDLVFYLSKTDAWDDNGRLVKIGRVRVKLDPAPLTSPFRQTLQLKQGMLEVVYGKGAQATTLRLWVDANHPVIHMAVDGPEPTTATASIELWRNKSYPLASLETSDLMEDPSKPGLLHRPVIVEPDTVLKDQGDRIGWYHHNAKSDGPAMIAKIQGLTGFKRPDPLLGRTFGAVIQADGGKRIDDTHLQSPSSKRHRLAIYVLSCYPSTSDQWLQAIDESIASTIKVPFQQRFAAHEQWWENFWNRSWINATTNVQATKVVADNAFTVSRAYALQRFINACAGRGAYPIKFNGSIFTVPYSGKPDDPDYRRWGPGYWWQNTRLPYASMCTAGDFDLMEPLFHMYATELMPLHKYRTKIQCGHDGAFIPECIYFWGDQFTATYGWTPLEKREDKLQQSGWHKWEWVSGLELVWMMFDYYEHTLDERFLTDTLLPTAREILTFFEQHYELSEDGTLVMHPSMACETWWDCINPMPEVAGLRAVTGRLLALPENQTNVEQRTFWTALQKKLPDLPTREVEGVKMLAPAEKFANKRNVENPELYAVFPFRLVAFEKTNAQLGIEALTHRWDKGNSGWRQDVIFMAYLGLTEDAREHLVDRAKNKEKNSRFPAFWGPNYDWVPDQTHGGVLTKTLQAMLIQTDGEKIHLLPAWPKDWDVNFKLHTPHKTTIECVYRDGNVQKLNVTPAERRKDVTVSQSLR